MIGVQPTIGDKTSTLTFVVVALAAHAAFAQDRSTEVKWHPGHYVTCLAGASAATVDRYLDSPAIRGVKVLYYWNALKCNYIFWYPLRQPSLDRDVIPVLQREKGLIVADRPGTALRAGNKGPGASTRPSANSTAEPIRPNRAPAQALHVDADFPGGNIVLEKIEGNAVYVRQDLRDTPSWFYWCFRVRGAAGCTLTFHFTKGNVIGVRGPAVSTDQGKTWRWLGAEAVKEASFAYPFPADAAEVRFCVGVPYQEEHLKAFLARQASSPHLKAETLCETKKGRDTELLRFGRLDGEPEHRVFLTARHHCCESLASYAMEGLIDFTLTDPDGGAWLRQHVEFLAVPFMDKDGVEDGDQGKNRKPHDHNRDYIQEIYPSVKAVKEKVPVWSGGKLRVALDLHCPGLRGSQHEVIHFVGVADQENWKHATQLAQILESVRKGPLVYQVGDNLAFGQAWNTAENLAKGGKLQSCSAWAAELPGISVACGMELPYANAKGGEVNAQTARAFGQDMARALRGYLETVK